MAYIAIILSENNLSDIIIEEIVCRNTCAECNYNIWITFYIFLWNYESIKVGVQLVFNTIWEWHRFIAVIWKNDTKSFIMLKQIRGHWNKPTYPFFSVILIILIKKLIKLSWNRFPVWGILWKNGSHFEQNDRHFLCRQKNITSNRMCTTLWYCLQNFVRITCVECNYNIWITFYIFLWNYESIKVGVQLVFNTTCTCIWEWHRFTAVIWKNDTKASYFLN
jgi:hypothetical protein